MTDSFIRNSWKRWPQRLGRCSLNRYESAGKFCLWKYRDRPFCYFSSQCSQNTDDYHFWPSAPAKSVIYKTKEKSKDPLMCKIRQLLVIHENVVLTTAAQPWNNGLPFRAGVCREGAWLVSSLTNADAAWSQVCAGGWPMSGGLPLGALEADRAELKMSQTIRRPVSAAVDFIRWATWV